MVHRCGLQRHELPRKLPHPLNAHPLNNSGLDGCNEKNKLATLGGKLEEKVMGCSPNTDSICAGVMRARVPYARVPYAGVLCDVAPTIGPNSEWRSAGGF
jgi:hypothetical protein